MTRIATLASSQVIINRLLDTQSNLQNLELQSSTGKVSSTYEGLAKSSQSLVNFETTRDKLKNFVSSNEQTDLRLQTTSTILDGIKTTMTDFREALFQYESGSLTDTTRIQDVQDAAFRALSTMQTNLNEEIDGRYVFSGARVTTQPVDLNLSTLSAFQSTYDGTSVLYPPSRDAHVDTDVTTSTTNTGNLTFTDNAATPDTITAATAGSLSSIPVGSVITVSGSGTHDGKYTVVSNNGTTITISGTLTVGSTSMTVTNDFTTADETVGATLSVSSYYSGDTASQSHRVADGRSFTMDTNAIDPAFEKAIRAMGIIAQGDLTNNPDRVEQAIYLINSAISSPPQSNPPFGTEDTSNVDQISQSLGYQRVLIDQTNQQHNQLINFFDQKVADTENTDPLEVISKLQSESNALQAAYAAVAKVQQLSLASYLS